MAMSSILRWKTITISVRDWLSNFRPLMDWIAKIGFLVHVFMKDKRVKG